MSLRINTNVEAANAHRHLNHTSTLLSKSMERLSSGFRINRAADDATGLAISEKMRSQVRGLAQAQRNIQDGFSMVQTTEGNLAEVHSMLQRIRELAVQYKNGVLTTSQRSAIQTEVNALASEISRVGATANFNGLALLAATTTVSFQAGANDADVITVTVTALATSLPAGYSNLAAAGAISAVDAAVDAVSAQRAGLGAVQNRLEYALNQIQVYQENLTAAESRIRDVDMAEEMVHFTKNQILQQASMAMLAQANAAPQSVLNLLR